MRIVGGRWRGQKLADLGDGDAKAHLRPTTDRVRENLFNLLINGRHGNLVANARVLDLFAGTGALGLEALSRGATWATFVDNGSTAQGFIRQNIARCGAGRMAKVLCCDATDLGRGRAHDLVFADPPYHDSGVGAVAIEKALKSGWMGPRATLLWETSTPPILPAGLVVLDQRRYGRAIVTLAARVIDLGNSGTL